MFARLTTLIHHDPKRRLYIDLDASKEFGFGAMAYHNKRRVDNEATEPPKKTEIEPILFLSKLLNEAEVRYWPTELELAGLVWVI